jgi:hypothetical protein
MFTAHKIASTFVTFVVCHLQTHIIIIIMFTRFCIPFYMFRTQKWHATPPGQNVIDEVAAVPAVRDIDDDDYLSEDYTNYDGVSLFPSTLTLEDRERVAAAKAAAKAEAEARRKLVEPAYVTAPRLEWPTWVPQDETPLEQNIIDEVAAAPAVRDIDDDDYLSEDADDEVAVQDDELVEEEPVAIVMIVLPPLRRSKRVAAQQCNALRSAVAPSPYATTGLRRSARIAGKPRVNYKY